MELSTGKQNSNTSSIFENKVRGFQLFVFTEKDQNVVMGSSIVKKLMDDSLPGDVFVHAYSGSTTSKNLKSLTNTQRKKLRTIILQNGTKALFENANKPVSKLFQDFMTLVEKLPKKFKSDFFISFASATLTEI